MKRTTTNNTNDTTNDATINTNDATNDNAKSRDAHARATSKTRFTIAQLSRELSINEKIARRRFRDAIARNDERAIRARDDSRNQRAINNVVRDARLTHEFDASLRDDVIAIITRA